MLVADDHPVNRLVFREIFVHLGCEVAVVEDGEQALLLAAVAAFVLIAAYDGGLRAALEFQLALASTLETVRYGSRMNRERIEA